MVKPGIRILKFTILSAILVYIKTYTLKETDYMRNCDGYLSKMKASGVMQAAAKMNL